MHSSDHTFPGTPAEKAMIMSAMAKVEFKGIPNRKEIKDKSFGSLDQVAQYLTDHPEYKANLVGHTGMTLTEESAENLGIDRAKSVKACLVSKGVNAANLSTRTDADASMEGEVTSSEDRQANRRVEIEIYN
jgi:outer membrane protein OmpA-like peptidoglycan-associated protein